MESEQIHVKFTSVAISVYKPLIPWNHASALSRNLMTTHFKAMYTVGLSVQGPPSALIFPVFAHQATFAYIEGLANLLSLTRGTGFFICVNFCLDNNGCR